MSEQYAQRDAAFADFLRTWKPSLEGPQQSAFNAGWAARKLADYHAAIGDYSLAEGDLPLALDIGKAK